MNTTGNRNRDLNEPISLAQKCVIGLLRLLLPPHADNEDAADYLRTKIGQNDHVTTTILEIIDQLSANSIDLFEVFRDIPVRP